MKKNFILTLVLTLTLFFVSFNINPVKAEPIEEVSLFDGASSFKVTQNLINADIGYGITHIKDYAQSRSTRLNNYESCGPKDVYVGQQMNVLSVPSNEAIRIVNWTYMTKDGWTKQTVRKLAQNFEYHNPGWKVVAGVNGDFFDINGNGALPYTMNGIGVSDGEVYKPYGSATNVGFKNDGSSYPLVGGYGCETGPLKLQVLDENDNLVKEYDVTKTNESLTGEGVSVWFSYYVMNETREEVNVTVGTNNTFFVESPVRCLPMNVSTIYAKGVAKKLETETTLKIGQFAIETTNSEIANYINEGYVIRVQQNLVGKFAECDNITGAGEHLLINGEAVDNGAKQDRHPRTVVGIKEDGSVVFMTVDGRQFDDNMYGMNFDELSAALLYYGCVEAYNLDGGGSTTFITRNSNGDFDVHNSPSDSGGERYDSNALLVVVPEISFNIDYVTDNSVTFSYQNNPETQLSNLKITVNNQTYTSNEKTLTIDGLNSKSKYTLSYTYDIVYKNSSLKNLSNSMSFTTGKTKPVIKNFYYEEDETNYIIHYNIVDPDKATSACHIKYDKSTYDIDTTKNIVTISKSKVKDPSTFTLNGRYDFNSSHSSAIKFTYKVDTFKDYTITYHLDGGLNDTLNPATYNPNTEPFYLFDPIKLGYTFKGWYTEPNGGEKVLYIENTERGSFDLYARWEATKYNITYILIDGINSENNPTTFTIEDLPLKLEAPTKEGYIFKGWTINNKVTDTIPVDQLKDISIIANWEKVEEKGCNCGCSKDLAMLFATISLISISYLIIKKKH